MKCQSTPRCGLWTLPAPWKAPSDLSTVPWKTPSAFPTVPTGPSCFFLWNLLSVCGDPYDTDCPRPEWPVFKCSPVAAFQCSVTRQHGGVAGLSKRPLPLCRSTAVYGNGYWLIMQKQNSS